MKKDLRVGDGMGWGLCCLIIDAGRCFPWGIFFLHLRCRAAAKGHLGNTPWRWHCMTLDEVGRGARVRRRLLALCVLSLFSFSRITMDMGICLAQRFSLFLFL